MWIFNASRYGLQRPVFAPPPSSRRPKPSPSGQRRQQYSRGCSSHSAEQSCVPANQPGRRTEAIAGIIDKHSFIDLYIITLGDNHFFDSASVKTELPKLVKPILQAGARCAFVSPTEGLGRFSNKTALISNLKIANDLVRSELGRSCVFIDSYTVGKDVLKTNADLELMRDAVSGDPMKLHPRGAGAKLWAERVFDSLKSQGLLDSL